MLIAAALTTSVSAQKTQTITYQSIPGVKPRNVIFILSDDHRYDFMGFTGKVPGLKTPNLDRIALEGAHLENAFVTTSLCSPQLHIQSPGNILKSRITNQIIYLVRIFFYII